MQVNAMRTIIDELKGPCIIAIKMNDVGKPSK